MRFVSIAFGLIVAIGLPIGAHAGQDPVLTPGPWNITPPAVAAATNQSWRAPLLSNDANSSPGTSAALANRFNHPLRYSIGTEWAVRAAAVALHARASVANGARYTGDIGQQAAAWQEALPPPIDIRTGTSQTAP
jgi:hypothetical protein